jgi:phytoene dehydrogenase-like protein
MGHLVKELTNKATSLGVTFKTSAEVTEISSERVVTCSDGRSYTGEYILANCAPQVLAKLMGTPAPKSLEGSQVKINMLLRKLPRLKSGVDPRQGFAGTFHFDERYSDLQKAYAQSAAGIVPDVIPAEMYCHTLTDTSILSPELVASGYQTLTLFGIHTPAALFDKDNEGTKKEITARLLRQLNRYLLDPIEECLAKNSDGTLCIEVKSPLDLEESISLPRGNIFHKDLSFPFREDGTPASWGVETTHPNIFICGAGAIRGGGVSGIPGHNAAMALLESAAHL